MIANIFFFTLPGPAGIFGGGGGAGGAGRTVGGARKHLSTLIRLQADGG